MKEYKVVNGTFYDVRTPIEVFDVLEKARMNRTRLHISFGDVATGHDWLEENDVLGFIARSTGSIKIPLLVHNRRSFGGPGLLDHCIVRIRASAGGRVFYQHPKYHQGAFEIRQKAEPITVSDGRVLTVDILRDGVVHASFESFSKARQWIYKLGITAPIAA